MPFPSNSRLKRYKPLKRASPPRRSEKPIARVSKRGKAILKRDAQFQADIPTDARCLIGKDCLGDLIKHHKKRRRHLDTRWDDTNTDIFCVKHHAELHTIGEKTFRRKYGAAVPDEPTDNHAE